jgi:hypothetical protein
MHSIPISLVPITGLVEVHNSVGDILCVTAASQNAWRAQVIRGARNQRRSPPVILYLETLDLPILKTAVDEFFDGNYLRFKESSMSHPNRKWMYLSFLGMALMMFLGLTFLAYMISVFLKLN